MINGYESKMDFLEALEMLTLLHSQKVMKAINKVDFGNYNLASKLSLLKRANITSQLGRLNPDQLAVEKYFLKMKALNG